MREPSLLLTSPLLFNSALLLRGTASPLLVADIESMLGRWLATGMGGGGWSYPFPSQASFGDALELATDDLRPLAVAVPPVTIEALEYR